ncbi:Leucine--tRNA ligase, cytoplasmic [Camellia lanceoleosa]|uniref:Leucine--tRNA ligase, cytoplasmic n=1 Tax=Camellia lanceoleosa TaxID=1840588 RepID=A0ACC0FSR6_9ERIC|nr:Leucine--tRNA ligase, cytoplasmic [Camellia lanceoleosa]
MYSEPKKKVISRAEDECIVALIDHWYITYGESNLKEEADKYLAKGLTVEGILENWSKIKPVILEAWAKNRDALIELFGKVRDEWMDNDLVTWIGANR